MTQPLTTQDLPQWEKDLLTARRRPEQDPTHTCLTPRGRAPYVCLRVRIVRVRGRDEGWIITCLDCAWAERHDIAHQAAESGRVHTANHGGRRG